MQAAPGNWLVVEQSSLDRTPRKGRILEVRSTDGTPPYLVHWEDSDHDALVFPGPDCHVCTDEEMADAATRRHFP